MILGVNGHVAALHVPCVRPELRPHTITPPPEVVSDEASSAETDSLGSDFVIPVRTVVEQVGEGEESNGGNGEEEYTCAPLASTLSSSAAPVNSVPAVQAGSSVTPVTATRVQPHQTQTQPQTPVARALHAVTWELGDANNKQNLPPRVPTNAGAGDVEQNDPQREYINMGKHAFDFHQATVAAVMGERERTKPAPMVPTAKPILLRKGSVGSCVSAELTVDSVTSDPGPICSPASVSSPGADSGMFP